MSSEPSQIGSCEITQTFGTDALGSVNLASHTPTGKTALMRILSESICADAAYRDRFLLEAKSGGRLQHVGIPRLLDSGGTGNRLFFASEFHGGESLLGMATRRARSEATSLKIGLCIADALRFAWEKEQLVHRGLSLANVLIGEDGVVRIYELGMAKPSGGVFGDIRFAAPEQLMGRSSTDHRLDMFSLGMILHSVLTGQLPPAVTIPAAIKLTDPRAVNPNLTVASCRIMEKLLAREPAHRYRGWEEVSRDISHALRGEDVQSQPPPTGNSVLVFNTPLPPPAANHAVTAAVEPAVVELKSSDSQSKPAAAPPPPAESSAAAEGAAAQGKPSFLKKNAAALLIGSTVVVVIITAFVLYRYFTHDPFDDFLRSKTAPPEEQTPESPPEEPKPEEPPKEQAQEPPPPIEQPPEPPPESPPEPVAKNPAKEFADIRAFANANPNAHAELIEKLRQFLDQFPEAPDAASALALRLFTETKLAKGQAEEQRQRDQEEARQREETERKEAEARQQAELKQQKEEAAARAKEAFPKFLKQFYAALSDRKYEAAFSLAREQLNDPDFESFKSQLTACANASERLKKFWNDLPEQLARAKGRTVTIRGITGSIDEVTGHDVMLKRESGGIGVSVVEASTAEVLELGSLFLDDSADAALTKAWFCFADGKNAEAGAFLDAAQKADASAEVERATMIALSDDFRDADAERLTSVFRTTITAQDWSAARMSLDLLKGAYAQTPAWQSAQRDIAPMEGMLTYHEDMVRLPAASVFRTYQHPSAVTCVAFHPLGRLVASASRGTVRFWDMMTNQVAREIETGFAAGIGFLAITPNGRLMVAAGADANTVVKVVDISTGRKIASYNPNATQLAVSPDGRFLSGFVGGYLKLWYLKSGRPVKEFVSGPWGIQIAEFTPDGSHLVAVLRVNDQIVRWLDLPTGKVVDELKSVTLPIGAMTFTSDSKTLIAVTNDGAFKVCTRDAEGEPRSFGNGVNAYAGLALSADDRYVAAAVGGGRIKLWNVTTGRAVRLFQGHTAPVRGIAYSPDQRFVVSGSDDRTLRVWKLWDGDSTPPMPRSTAIVPR